MCVFKVMPLLIRRETKKKKLWGKLCTVQDKQSGSNRLESAAELRVAFVRDKQSEYSDLPWTVSTFHTKPR